MSEQTATVLSIIGQLRQDVQRIQSAGGHRFDLQPGPGQLTGAILELDERLRALQNDVLAIQAHLGL